MSDILLTCPHINHSKISLKARKHLIPLHNTHHNPNPPWIFSIYPTFDMYPNPTISSGPVCSKSHYFKFNHHSSSSVGLDHVTPDHVTPDHENPLVMGGECHICHRQFRHVVSVKRHIESVHYKLKPYSCDLCGRSFARKEKVL